MTWSGLHALGLRNPEAHEDFRSRGLMFFLEMGPCAVLIVGLIVVLSGLQAVAQQSCTVHGGAAGPGPCMRHPPAPPPPPGFERAGSATSKCP